VVVVVERKALVEPLELEVQVVVETGAKVQTAEPQEPH
jgi:hypothetical protein